MEQLNSEKLNGLLRGVEDVLATPLSTDWLVDEIANRGRMAIHTDSFPPNPEVILSGIRGYTFVRFSVGQIVRDWRLNQDLDVTGFANKAELEKGYINQIEHNKIRTPSDPILVQMANGLGINLLYLKLRIPSLTSNLWNNPMPTDQLRDLQKNDQAYPMNSELVTESIQRLDFIKYPFASVLRTWREYRGLRTSDFDRLGSVSDTKFPRGHISQIENGKVSLPTTATVIALANTLNIHYSYLLLGIPQI